MERVKEPELMVNYEQVVAYAEADFSLSEEDLISEIADFVNYSGAVVEKDHLIIDLGCGPGNITERLSSLWPKSRIIGIDDSLNMIKYAKRKKNLKTLTSSNQISYEKLNLSSIANDDSKYGKSADVVVSNSLIHHIHDIEIFFRTLMKISKKGTIHYHRDLRRPSSHEEFESIKKKYITSSNSILKKDFIASLKAAHNVKEISKYLKRQGLDYLSVKEVGDRYVDVFGICS